MNKPHYLLDAELTLRVGDSLLANTKRMELLRQIGLTENLTKAAKISGYSYKGAWDTIEQMTQLTGGSLLERHAGGKGGGRTRLTDRGKQLLRNFLLIQSEHHRFIQRLNHLANGLESEYEFQTEIAMKTSARNQFAGIIVTILQGVVNDEITLMVNGSLMLVSSITHDSSRELHLDIGSKVFALIKASSIELHLPDEKPPSAQRNMFHGTIHTVTLGQTRSEVAVMIEGGLELTCTISNQDIQRLNIQEMARIGVSINPANVIIGVAA